VVRFAFRFRAAVTVIVDVAVCLASGAVVILALYLQETDLRAFVFLGLAFGFICERISIGFLIAKTAEKLYNAVKRLWWKFFHLRRRKEKK